MVSIRELVSSLGVWLAVADALGGCRPAATETDRSEPTVVVRAAITGGFEPGTAITPAGFVSLGTSTQAVRLGPRGHFASDLALANGGVDIGSDSDAVAPWRVAGTLTIEPQARVTGDLTIGGVLARGAQTTLNGTVTQHASVPQLTFPSTTGLLGQLGASFGTTTSADIFARSRGSQALAAGGRRVVNLTLQQGARLLVTGTSALEVTGSVNLGPQARITVSGGGRLLLLRPPDRRDVHRCGHRAGGPGAGTRAHRGARLGRDDALGDERAVRAGPGLRRRSGGLDEEDHAVRRGQGERLAGRDRGLDLADLADHADPRYLACVGVSRRSRSRCCTRWIATNAPCHPARRRPRSRASCPTPPASIGCRSRTRARHRAP